ncbi:uncharacterized protein A4U43_C04F14800 [Asparagus officinalis]|uniref:Uncharacterized protein n=1 Tax=Asparagus officinalis TaxID=4686 RepID=A0A5P1F5M0_ASPOF|nr:uncharacterized protein A4U43_C04F14800 [Asparagus officinalis]
MARHIMKKRAFSEHKWPTLCWPEFVVGELVVAACCLGFGCVGLGCSLISFLGIVLCFPRVAAACCLGFGCVGLLQILFLGIVLCFPRVAAPCCLGFGCVGLLHLLFLGIVLCFPSVQTLVFFVLACGWSLLGCNLDLVSLLLGFPWLQQLVAWGLVVIVILQLLFLSIVLCLAFGFMLMLGLCFNSVYGFNLLLVLVSALVWLLEAVAAGDGVEGGDDKKEEREERQMVTEGEAGEGDDEVGRKDEEGEEEG